MDTFQSQIEEFSNYIQNERRLSPHTLTAYQTDLRQFQDFLEETLILKSFTEGTYNEIRMWIIHLKENEISNRSINRKISTLKSLYKYFITKQKVKVNPMLKIIAPKQSKKLPVYFDQKLLNNLFNSEVFTNDFIGIRDILIMELLYGTGMRLAELINIKQTDIDNLEIKVLGKGNKERIIPITKNIASFISLYNEKRKKEFTTRNNDFLSDYQFCFSFERKPS